MSGIAIGLKLANCLVVGGPLHRKGRTFFILRCDCGKTWQSRRDVIKAGRVKSCGCKRVEYTSAANTTHGRCSRIKPKPEYKSWQAMLERCYNRKHKSYADYGGRGIKVANCWRHNFSAFFTDMGERPIGTTLDRINSDGDYESGNCRWATKKEQQQNRRCTVRVEVGGKSICLADVRDVLGLSERTIARHVKSRQITHQVAVDKLLEARHAA